MITHTYDMPGDDTGTDINRESAKYKYGGDPMAEYLSMLAGIQGQDEETGTVEWHYWVGRFGKRLLFNDDQGFVWVEKHENEAAAQQAFNAIAEEYGAWADENEDF